MDGEEAGAVKNLLATGGAGCGDEGGCVAVVSFHGFANSGKEYLFADGDGGLVVFFFVAERAGHAAAGGGYDVEAAARKKSEEVGGLLDADEGFLVAVSVEPDFEGEVEELPGRDVPPLDFTHKEFVV